MNAAAARLVAAFDRVLSAESDRWRPNPGAQTRLLDFIRRNPGIDQVCYCGQAGGGKTHASFGLASLEFRNAIFFRRQLKDHRGPKGPMDTVERDFKGHLNRQENVFTFNDGRTLTFAGLMHEHKKESHQGVPRDLYIFDELPHLSRSAVDYVSMWRRTDQQDQRTLELFLFNPPIDSRGAWVTDMVRPWVDPRHSRPAAEGEIRYFFRKADGAEVEVETGEPSLFEGQVRRPKSRTCFRSVLAENPTYGEEYARVLDAAGEPIRSMMRDGNFFAQLTDRLGQVIPSRWVVAAQDRRRGEIARGYDPRFDETGKPVSADSWGKDVAGGGADNDVTIGRWGDWFEEPLIIPGVEIKSGTDSARPLIERMRRHGGYAWIDATGLGLSCFERVRDVVGQSARPFYAAEGTEIRDRLKVLSFQNRRSAAWQLMRDALDPEGDREMSLPLHAHVFEDLTIAVAEYRGKMAVAPKKFQRLELSRSPDVGDALLMANLPPSLGLEETGWSEMVRAGTSLRLQG